MLVLLSAQPELEASRWKENAIGKEIKAIFMLLLQLTTSEEIRDH